MADVLAFIADAYPPAIGGGERFNAELVKRLRAEGSVVEVIVPGPGPTETGLVRIPSRRVGPAFIMSPLRMFLILARLRPARVVLVGPSVNNATGALCCALLRLRYAAYFYGDLDWSSRAGRIFEPMYFRFVLGRAARVFTYSHVLSRVLGERGVSSSKIVATGIGSEETLEAPRLRSERHGLVFVGGLGSAHAYKRLDLLIRALTEIEDMQLDIVGRGDPTAYETLASGIGVRNRVTFHGTVDEETRRNLVARAVALVLPSPTSREGFGLVALEAMRLGTPVVVGRNAGSAELIDFTGFGSTWIGGATDLASAIREVVAFDQDRLAAGYEAFARIDHRYRMSAVAFAVMHAIAEL